MKRFIKWLRTNKDDVVGFIKFMLFMSALTMIFKIAPSIAEYIVNVDLETMTTFVEWFMCLCFALILLTPFVDKRGRK